MILQRVATVVHLCFVSVLCIIKLPIGTARATECGAQHLSGAEVVILHHDVGIAGNVAVGVEQVVTVRVKVVVLAHALLQLI